MRYIFKIVFSLDLTLTAEAMDRIHRLGQRRPVKAIKLVIEDSIESRIVQLQEKKSAMVDATLSSDDSVRALVSPPHCSCTSAHVIRLTCRQWGD